MSANITRRATFKAVPALLLSSPLALAGQGGDDQEWQRRLAEYLALKSETAAAQAHMHSVRDAIEEALEAKYPRPDNHMQECEWWRRTNRERQAALGFHESWEVFNEKAKILSRVVREIRHAEAVSLFALGVKLVAMPSDFAGEDCQEGMSSVLDDIDKLCGTSLQEASGFLTADHFDDEDDDEEDADV